MAGIKVTMRKARETKGTWMYAEEGDNVKIGTLYVKKSSLPDLNNAETIEITVTEKKGK